MTLPAWTREPLVHFLVAGFVLFVALTWSSGGSVDPASRVIDIDRGTQAQLSLQFERTMGRAPTDAEMDGAIERYVRDEVLYREAIRLGLDQGDAVVRRRLVSKMDLSASAAAEAAEPTAEALQEFYSTNRDRYADTGSVSFDQLYFGSEEAAQAAARLADPEGASEAISLPAALENVSQQEVQTRLGEAFTAALSEMKVGEQWQGPIRSGFGWHLVRLRARGAGDAPPLEDIRERVADDWRSAEITKRKEASFQVLRDAYRVEIAK